MSKRATRKLEAMTPLPSPEWMPSRSSSTSIVEVRHAAQRRGGPQLGVVAAARIEAHHQARRADPLGQVIDVRRQVIAARLLRRLDDDHAARVRDLVAPQGVDRGQRREQRVSVVGAAAPEQPLAPHHRHPRTEALLPALHLRLLVEVAVQHHGVAFLAAGGRHLDEDRRRPPLQPHDLGGWPRRASWPWPTRGAARRPVPCGPSSASRARTWATCLGCGCSR